MGNSSSSSSSSSSTSSSVMRQEQYVDKHFQNIRNNPNSSNYSNAQIRGKLRQEFHGSFSGSASASNNYISAHDWSNIRTQK